MRRENEVAIEPRRTNHQTQHAMNQMMTMVAMRRRKMMKKQRKQRQMKRPGRWRDVGKAA